MHLPYVHASPFRFGRVHARLPTYRADPKKLLSKRPHRQDYPGSTISGTAGYLGMQIISWTLVSKNATVNAGVRTIAVSAPVGSAAQGAAFARVTS